jgi:hypothetical protein
MAQCELGRAMLQQKDLEVVRKGGWFLFTGAYYLGTRCSVSKTEEEYWRRKRCAKGGRGEKEKRKGRREAMEAWQLYAATLEGANTKTSITDLAGSLLIDPKRPVATPSNSRTLGRVDSFYPEPCGCDA